MMSEVQEPDFHSQILDENEDLRRELRHLKENFASTDSEEIDKLRRELLAVKELENDQVTRLRTELAELRESSGKAEMEVRLELGRVHSEVEADFRQKLEVSGREISDLKSKLNSAELKLAETEDKCLKVRKV
jgi:hypothetical protein